MKKLVQTLKGYHHVIEQKRLLSTSTEPITQLKWRRGNEQAVMICHVTLSCLSETERLKRRVIQTVKLISWTVSVISTLGGKPARRFKVRNKNSSIISLLVKKSLYTSQVVHQVDAYLWFLWHEATRSISTPFQDAMLVQCRVTPSIKFDVTHLYTWVERGSMRVKCLA